MGLACSETEACARAYARSSSESSSNNRWNDFLSRVTRLNGLHVIAVRRLTVPGDLPISLASNAAVRSRSRKERLTEGSVTALSSVNQSERGGHSANNVLVRSGDSEVER